MWFCTDFVVHEFSTINKFTTGRLPVFLFLFVSICMHSILFVFAFDSICAMDIKVEAGEGKIGSESNSVPQTLFQQSHIFALREALYIHCHV